LPASLHARALEVAEFEEISLTDVVISALKNYIEKEELKKPVEFD
jgi:predicted HicB family RNase H-like nuclease